MPAVLLIILIVAVIALVCWLITMYFTGAWWVISHFGVSIGVAAGAAGIALLIGCLARGLMGTYARRGVRATIWAPIGLVLALIGVDLLWLLTSAALEVAPGDAARAIYAGLAPLVIGGWGSRTALEWVVTSLPGGIPAEMAVLFALGFKFLALVPLLVLARGMECEVPSTKEPARIQYFFGAARADLRAALTDASQRLIEAWRRVGEGLREATFGGVWGWVTWPFTLCVALGAIVPIVVTIACTILIFVLASTALAVVWLLNAYAAILLGWMERAVLRARSGHARCPHAGCHAKVALPVFACPSCGAKHQRLVPDRHGVLKRACQCGHLLPTAFWLGKGRLLSFCPTCSRPMHTALFDASVHVPIYGAPSAGKTMLLMASVWTLSERKLGNLGAAFIDPAEEELYRRRWKPSFENGVTRDKTTELYPEAVLVSLRRGRGLPVSLYLYDAAGDALTRETHLAEHRFLRFFDGMLFVIDPFALASVRRALGESAEDSDDEDIRTQLQRLHNALTRHQAVGKGGRTSQRLAVVLSKTDRGGVRELLGLTPVMPHTTRDWRQAGSGESAAIEAWLRREEPSFTQALGTWFTEVRFFAVSATGGAEAGSAFRPGNAVAPLLWLLSQRAALQRPIPARAAGQAGEWAAAGAVAAGLLGLPVFLGATLVQPALGAWYDSSRGFVPVPGYRPRALEIGVDPPETPKSAKSKPKTAGAGRGTQAGTSAASEGDEGVAWSGPGSWSGTGRQYRPVESWSINVSFHNGIKDGLAGNVEYPSIRCEGILVADDVDLSAGTFAATEKIQLGSCVNGGSFRFKADHAGNLEWRWFYPSGEEGAKGLLKRN